NSSAAGAEKKIRHYCPRATLLRHSRRQIPCRYDLPTGRSSLAHTAAGDHAPAGPARREAEKNRGTEWQHELRTVVTAVLSFASGHLHRDCRRAQSAAGG